MAAPAVLQPPSRFPASSPPQPASPTSTASDTTPTSSTRGSVAHVAARGVSNGVGRMVKVIVVSDLVCPWCYIGFKTLNAALSKLALETIASGKPAQVEFEVEYRPYPLISSQFPSDDVAIEKTAYFEKRFGKAKFKEMGVALAKKGQELGINFKTGGFIRRTYRAHRLLTLAYTKGGSPLQQSLLANLFSAYFEKEEDIGAPATLARYACLAGLFNDSEVAEEWIKGTEGEEGVNRLFQISQGCGINGVPFVVVDGRWAISGCQGLEEYYKVLEKISKGDMSSDKEIKENLPDSGRVCAPPV